MGNNLAVDRNGDPGRTRTCNPELRRLVLYPVELRDLIVLIRWLRRVSASTDRCAHT